jgi:hypothetical protein
MRRISHDFIRPALQKEKRFRGRNIVATHDELQMEQMLKRWLFIIYLLFYYLL